IGPDNNLGGYRHHATPRITAVLRVDDYIVTTSDRRVGICVRKDYSRGVILHIDFLGSAVTPVDIVYRTGCRVKEERFNLDGKRRATPAAGKELEARFHKTRLCANAGRENRHQQCQQEEKLTLRAHLKSIPETRSKPL